MYSNIPYLSRTPPVSSPYYSSLHQSKPVAWGMERFQVRGFGIEIMNGRTSQRFFEKMFCSQLPQLPNDFPGENNKINMYIYI